MQRINFENTVIIQYISISERDVGDMHFCTTASKFRRDIETLLNSGYSSASLQEVFNQEYYDTQKKFCIVFQGGYENNYILAFPVLKELNVKASIFISTDLVGATSLPGAENFIPHFNWAQAQEMVDSGLISIFPMWHPFDIKKDFKKEVKNKFNLLNQQLHQENSCFAFLMNSYDKDKLFILREFGTKVVVTDYYNITSNDIDNGATPSIVGSYYADIFDVVNQYFAAINIAHKKNEFISSTPAVCSPPDDKILATSVFLPIDSHPVSRNYLRHAFPLSILQSEHKAKAERIILSDYIDIVYKPWCDLFDYHNYLYEYWDCIDYLKITKDILDINHINVVEYIINGLKAGYYADVWLDTYYIPQKFGYNKKHMTHGILIYGYNAEEQSFTVVSNTNKERYCSFSVSINDVALGCSNCYFEALSLIKVNEKSIVEYDIRKIYKKLYNYIHSITYDDNSKYNKKSSEQFYNFSACEAFIKDVELKFKNENCIHIIPLYSFSEHKRLMMWRLKYINEIEQLGLIDFNDRAGDIIKKSERLVNLGLKYNVLKTSKTATSIVSLGQELNLKEKDLINELIHALNSLLIN